MTSPTLAYDREANALSFRFTDHKVMETVELSETVYVDMYTDGEPVGFEILHAEPSRLWSIPALPDTASLRDLVKASAV
ncbi:MAG: DUF2283 domain-containing protein [Chloroflexota bacterium]|nr:DUF2283 domain-containing protein [Chloroflexota bacterium]